jgi:hypothetical protein
MWYTVCPKCNSGHDSGEGKCSDCGAVFPITNLKHRISPMDDCNNTSLAQVDSLDNSMKGSFEERDLAGAVFCRIWLLIFGIWFIFNKMWGWAAAFYLVVVTSVLITKGFPGANYSGTNNIRIVISIILKSLGIIPPYQASESRSFYVHHANGSLKIVDPSEDGWFCLLFGCFWFLSKGMWVMALSSFIVTLTFAIIGFIGYSWGYILVLFSWYFFFSYFDITYHKHLIKQGYFRLEYIEESFFDQ